MEGSTSNEKIVIRRKAAALTLRDGEVVYKKGMHTHGILEVALGMVLSHSNAESEFIHEQWKIPLVNSF